MSFPVGPEAVHRESLHVIGMKWQGSFAEAGAGGIREVQQQFKQRLQEISNLVNPDALLGLSYDMTEQGFTHLTAVEVKELGEIPEGMVSLTVPAADYARCKHAKGQDIDASYQNLYAWIEQQGYRPQGEGLTHYEEYPMSQDTYDPQPEFTILIPMVKA
ncbi:AraC family transcriptional regulator [Paenibacillus sp. CAA11]|uniref:GyrI-like domain-containing protein n=1 Tax=Paenibacillus sp. CAA11 TaxID=1532905 RepID=UPI000D36485C|nr:GyrI-like domain-containing protein [Paenibacillus sp. CAA11]AWB46434.1 AraC family transcriptional regulator [Paenibacillus sp. CAA11]